MKDEDIIENIMTIYNTLLKTLPRNKENIKNIEIKFTMTKPYKIIYKMKTKTPNKKQKTAHIPEKKKKAVIRIIKTSSRKENFINCIYKKYSRFTISRNS